MYDRAKATHGKAWHMQTFDALIAPAGANGWSLPSQTVAAGVTIRNSAPVHLQTPPTYDRTRGGGSPLTRGGLLMISAHDVTRTVYGKWYATYGSAACLISRTEHRRDRYPLSMMDRDVPLRTSKAISTSACRCIPDAAAETLFSDTDGQRRRG